jgi:hypothetical protein
MTEGARLLMEEFQSLLPGAPSRTLSNGASGPWLLGLAEPSALDAHLITFIARMLEVCGGGDGAELVEIYDAGRKTMVTP